MRLRNLWLAAAATASLAALGACKSDELLGVENTNNPDVARAFATPDGVENVLKNGFVQIFGATHGTSTAIWPAAQATALESYGSVANFGLNLRASIPRSVIDNTRGNPTAAENLDEARRVARDHVQVRALAHLHALQELVDQRHGVSPPSRRSAARWCR